MNSKTKLKTIDLVLIGAFAALMAICAWITIPGTVPFTLQTFGVFIAFYLLGGKRGTIAVLIYILLGAVGLPVFSGFKGGYGVLIGTTGGYIVGFLFSALVMWALYRPFEKLEKKNKVTKLLVPFCEMIIGLIVCYAFGTAWFMVVYTQTKGALSLATCLSWCVIPFIIPDLIKIALALLLGFRLRPFVPGNK
ncbi:MAG: biotin transporter BioY [Lachnospiraceae bacterium]|nr:biotin transporter BioY [Lachnospiraceae bacterium]